MPIYEYRCKDGHTFEVMQRMSDDPVVACETCAAPVERVFRPVAVHFKGSGFYNTDYGTRKRSREREAQEAKDKPSKDGSSKDGSSKDGKSSQSDSASAKKTESSATASSSSE